MGEEIFKIIGALGLVSLIIGTLMLSNKKVKRGKVYPFLLAGGILLAIYSFYIDDIIFIVLQVFYIATVFYDIFELMKEEKNKKTIHKRAKKTTKKKKSKNKSNKMLKNP